MEDKSCLDGDLYGASKSIKNLTLRSSRKSGLLLVSQQQYLETEMSYECEAHIRFNAKHC